MIRSSRYAYANLDGGFGVTRPYVMLGRLAVVPVEGELTFGAPAWEMMMSGGISTALIAGIIASVASNPEIDAMLLDINSPGGAVFGRADLVDAIESVRKSGKKVYAAAHDLCASLAYYAAAGADEIVATDSAIVGSIGCMWATEDSSELYKRMGIKPFVASSGALKGAGVDGTPLTDEKKAEMQRFVQDDAREFFAYVGQRRGITPDAIAALQGGMFSARTALQHKLIDRVVPSFQSYLAELMSRHGSPVAADVSREPLSPPQPTPAVPSEAAGVTPMPEITPNTTPANTAPSVDPLASTPPTAPKVVATPTQLKALTTTRNAKGETKYDAEFIWDAYERKLSLEEAAVEFAGRKAEEAARLQEELAKKPKAIGNPVVDLGNQEAPSAPKTFADAVRAVAATEKVPLLIAIGRAAKKPENRALHTAWVAENCPAITAA